MNDSFGAYRPGDGLQQWVTTPPAKSSPFPPLAGSGSPEGTIEATPGTGYTDTDTNDFWVKYVGVSSLGWKKVGTSVAALFGGKGGGQVYSGSATDPNGVITATGPAYYYSTTDQSQWEKTSVALSDTGWIVFLG
jgi:hypothetical protein